MTIGQLLDKIREIEHLEAMDTQLPRADGRDPLKEFIEIIRNEEICQDNDEAEK